jgi:hypothetical protein
VRARARGLFCPVLFLSLAPLTLVAVVFLHANVLVYVNIAILALALALALALVRVFVLVLLTFLSVRRRVVVGGGESRRKVLWVSSAWVLVWMFFVSPFPPHLLTSVSLPCFFCGNEVVEFTLTATSFDALLGKDVSGSASVLVTVNRSPMSGRCYAEPRSGKSSVTKFSFVCQVRRHSCLVLPCLALSCLVSSCLVLACLVLSCHVMSWLGLALLGLACLGLFYHVLPCLVESCSA